MIEPGTRSIIMTLPELLLENARDCDDEMLAARMVRTAAMIEILTIAAPRIDNVRTLTIDKSFRRSVNGKNQITHIIVDELNVKNGIPIDKRLPKSSVDTIEVWLHDHRPKLAKPGNRWLFPGDDGTPLSISTVRNWISRAILDFARIEVHPHLFRHFCAWMHLQKYPGDYDGVRRILGHKSIQTSINSYIAFEKDIAAERYDDIVLQERKAARAVVKTAFHRSVGTVSTKRKSNAKIL
jgi:integrase